MACIAQRALAKIDRFDAGINRFSPTTEESREYYEIQ